MNWRRATRATLSPFTQALAEAGSTRRATALAASEKISKKMVAEPAPTTREDDLQHSRTPAASANALPPNFRRRQADEDCVGM